MELIQLKYFAAVAAYGSFTRGAEAMSISQPAISKSINALERELGAVLFIREKRKAVLTAEGSAFRSRVSNILTELDLAAKEVSGGSDVREVRLHVEESGFLLGLLESYLRSNPPIIVRQGRNKEQGLYQQLITGELEFCITQEPFSETGLEWVHLMTDRLFLFMPEGHRFQGRKSVSPEELKNEYFIVTSTAMANRLENMGRQLGFNPVISCEVDEQPSMMMMVEMGMGLGLCSSCMMIRRYVQDMAGDEKGPSQSAFTAIDGPFGRREIGISYVRDRAMTPLSRSFLKFTVGYFKDFEKQLELLPQI